MAVAELTAIAEAKRKATTLMLKLSKRGVDFLAFRMNDPVGWRGKDQDGETLWFICVTS